MPSKNFVYRNIRQINDGGYKVMHYKLIKFLKFIPLNIISLLIVFLIRVASLVVIIKLSPIDGSRVGSLYAAKFYLKLKKIDGLGKKNCIYLFFIHNQFGHVNYQWLKMWKKSINILPFSLLWQRVFAINRFFPNFKKYAMYNLYALTSPEMMKKDETFIKSLKNNNLDKITKIHHPVVELTKDKIKIGEKFLKKTGSSNYNFLCFHARDPSYLNKSFPKRDWSYHNFRDSDIQTYVPAVQKIAEKGITCYRMGATVEKKIHCSNQKIIDYGNSEDRSDFLDIYLSSKCRFFLCSMTGISIFPETFNRPIVYVNCYLIPQPFMNNSLFIFKKYYLNKEKRFMTFKEIYKLGKQNHAAKLRELDIKLIDNTPEEITELVLEMNSRLNSTWEIKKEDEDLQGRFWSLFDDTFIKSNTFRIGAEYLKKNENLLF